MHEEAPKWKAIRLPAGALDGLLASASAEQALEVGREIGLALADSIRESCAPVSPDWDAVGTALSESGIGILGRAEPGPGLLELWLEGSGLPRSAPALQRGLLEGLLTSLATEPVGVAVLPPASGDAPHHCIAGSPELIDRLRARLEAGDPVPVVMEEAWS